MHADCFSKRQQRDKNATPWDATPFGASSCFLVKASVVTGKLCHLEWSHWCHVLATECPMNEVLAIASVLLAGWIALKCTFKGSLLKVP